MSGNVQMRDHVRYLDVLQRLSQNNSHPIFFSLWALATRPPHFTTITRHYSSNARVIVMCSIEFFIRKQYNGMYDTIDKNISASCRFDFLTWSMMTVFDDIDDWK